MTKALRVLNIEDNLRDMALINRQITRAGYDLISERVETAADMKAALENKKWDLILCDYSMPHFSALGALGVLRQAGLDIPFIIISGTIGEELAVEAMLAGANDYLMKDKLARLVPAIERELAEARNRRARREAEESLKASEAELRAIFAAMTDVILVADAEGRFLKIAPTDHPYKPADHLVGKTFSEIYSKEKADFLLRQIHRALREGGMHRVEYSLPSRKGEVWLEGSVTPMTSDTVVWIARDITERKRAEDELRQSAKRYRLLFESNPHPMWVFDPETLVFLEVNSAAIHHYGFSREEFLSMTLKDIRPADEIPKLLNEVAEISNQYSAPQLWRHRKKDGTIINVELAAHSFTLNGKTVRLVLANDVTERKTLEEQLRQAQKMEAVGQLAGGVAHDFNNMLTAIIGNSELAMRRLPQPQQSAEDPIRFNLEEIKKAGERAATLTRQLLAFSRKQVLQPKVLDLNSIILEIEKMLHRLIGENIRLRTVLDSGLGSVKADPGQIEQVILNLAINARDAMPQGGNLTIETKNVYLDDEYASRHVGVTGGYYAMLAVSDTGTGMDAATRARIFEPFFTTKELGKGTGLGLSTVYGIVKQSGGSVWVYSEVGRGTTFKVYLPRVDDIPEDYKRNNKVEKHPEGTETILLVEDELMLRTLIRELLENCGYQVLEAANGGEALSICEGYPQPIDLLLTDLILPGIGGKELSDRLSEMRPAAKVIYMSGYTDDAIVHHGILDSGVEFLQKPFTLEDLAQKVYEILNTGKIQPISP